MKLLVVDDSKDITDVLMVYCESKGVECTVVNAGIDGLEIIRNNNNFDLILLDIAMPEFSGWDIIQSLKQDRLIESKNLVIFTASSNQKLLNDIKNSGLKVFKKPCSLDDLTELIEKYRPTIL